MSAPNIPQDANLTQLLREVGRVSTTQRNKLMRLAITKGATYQQVADTIGVSRQRVSQILKEDK